jgi:hypothetical protein
VYTFSMDDFDVLFERVKEQMRADRLWVFRTTVALVLVCVLGCVLLWLR